MTTINKCRNYPKSQNLKNTPKAICSACLKQGTASFVSGYNDGVYYCPYKMTLVETQAGGAWARP